MHERTLENVCLCEVFIIYSVIVVDCVHGPHCACLYACVCQYAVLNSNTRY